MHLLSCLSRATCVKQSVLATVLSRLQRVFSLFANRLLLYLVAPNASKVCEVFLAKFDGVLQGVVAHHLNIKAVLRYSSLSFI